MNKSAKSSLARQVLVLILVMVAIAVVFAVNNAPSSTVAQTEGEAHTVTLDDFAHSRVAAVTGTTPADAAVETWPEASMNYFGGISEVIMALNSGKVDCALVSYAVYQTFKQTYPNLACVEEPIEEEPKARGWAFPKGSKDTLVFQQFNEFIAQCKKDGTIDELNSIWMSADHATKTVPDFSTLPATNGSLYLVASGDEEPYNFWSGAKLTGFDIDLAYRFAKAYGYGLSIDPIPFESLILTISTGTYDFAAESLCITDERARAVDFTDPIFESISVVIYNTDTIESFIGAPVAISAQGPQDAVQSFIDTFTRTLIEGDRWQLLLEGLKVTLAMTLLSTVLATVIGYILMQFRRVSKHVGNTLINLYVKLFQGTPVLVMLIIFYYIVLGRSNASAIAIAILVFALNSAASIEEVLYDNVCAVDPGQREAALAAGYSEHQAFLRFILPPAITKSMPFYCGEIISLMKNTSIIGYVALMDLTKAGDIICSQTYEAIIPMVSIAIFYLLMAWLITLLMDAIERKLTPKNPLTQIRGVDMTAMDRFDAKAASKRPLVNATALGEPGEVLMEIKHLRKEYPHAVPLTDVNATIRRGDVISIIGPSGCGKSTLLRMLNQLEMPTAGDVYLEGQCITDDSCDINEVRQKMGMVFQTFNLYDRLSIVENIMIAPVNLRGAGRQESFERALELLERVGLRPKALVYPSELFGGQKQRVAIARALAMDSDILLLDEPTSELDPKMTGEVQRVITQLANAGMTMMIATHEMGFARKVSTRVFYMDEGVIYEEGTPEQIFEDPQRPKTREFVYNLSKAEATISPADSGAIDFSRELEDFAEHNLLAPKACYRVNMLYEELVLNGIIAHVPSDTQVHVAVEYSDDTGSIEFLVEYKGESLDPLTVIDDLAQVLVTHCTNGYKHRYENGFNYISVRIG